MQVKTDMDRLLMDSFKELALHTAIDKITVKEITDKAGVIRPTFYNHFQDKYEVIERIIQQEIIDPVKVLFSNGMVTEAVALIFVNMQKDKDFYLRLSKMQGPVSFEDIAKRRIKALLTEYVQGRKHAGHNGLPQWFTREYLAEYYAQALSYMVLTWIKNGMSVSPREMAELYDYMMTHSLNEAIDDLYDDSKA